MDVFILAKLGFNYIDHRREIHYYEGFSNGMYDFSTSIKDAKIFESREELFEYILKQPQLFNEAILLEYSKEYFNKIKDNPEICNNLRKLN